MVMMSDVSELKDMLEKIEGKIIAAGKIYAAMYFAYWLVAMIGYYLILPFSQSHVLLLSVIYWPVAVLVSFFVGWKSSMRMKEIEKNKSSKLLGILIFVSWSIGAFVGWSVLPSMSMGINDEASLAMGFLSFIGISILGMWLSFELFKMKSREMIPSFIFAFAGVPVAMNIHAGAMLWAGYMVAMGFSITVLLYLYSAFRTLEEA